jgi:allantoinase
LRALQPLLAVEFLVANDGWVASPVKAVSRRRRGPQARLYRACDPAILGHRGRRLATQAQPGVSKPGRSTLDALKLPATILLNSAVCYNYPDIVDKIKSRGDDVLGHGRTNAELLRGMWEDDERRAIEECTQVIEQYVGVRPTGWMGPGALESNVTPDLLKEAGYTHLLDWPFDDQPIWMQTRAGPLLSVPYPMELNDAGTLAHRDHSGREFADMIVDQFEEMLEQSERHPLVFALALHGFIVGQPFRLRPLRQAIKHCVDHKKKDQVWFTRAADIAKYCISLERGLIPDI